VVLGSIIFALSVIDAYDLVANAYNLAGDVYVLLLIDTVAAVLASS